MPSQTRADATILAHHLYDFAECEHRIALDVTLDKSQRARADEAMELLFEHGRAFEREVVAPLGYEAIDVAEGDWEGAFERTVALMREGVAGIDQGVLLGPGRLARPDLLERVAGASRLGDFQYRPGDVKTARSTRSDAVLQVAFAGLLLELVQGVRPSTGFLILGDGRREELDLEAIRYTVDDAVERAEAIARGEVATAPAFSPACARCRWREECLPRLEEARDVSFVHGLTRSRQRVLARHGMGTIEALAATNVAALAAAGLPTEGMERATLQARALIEGTVLRRARVPLPRGLRRELYLRIEVDPLDRGEPFLFAFGETAAGAGAMEVLRVVVASSENERRDAFAALVDVFESAPIRDEPVYVFGSGTARAFDGLAEAFALEPKRAGAIAGRLVDLAPWVRRAGVLPVFQYRFDEVAAVAMNVPRPSPAVPEDALFVRHAAMHGVAEAGPIRAELEFAGRESLTALGAIRRWLES
jgi:predicted RecB family nuclease